MTLKDKVVLVTGGSKGIGKACIEAFADQGASVVINYAHDKKAAEDLEILLKAKNVKVQVIKADITNHNELVAMVEEVKNKFGKLDVLVNNAGIFDNNDGIDGIDALENVFNYNLLAQASITKECRKIMSKGKIIFISSIHAKLGHGRPSAIAYSAIKAGLESYMKNLAKALAPDILVNAVAPGRTLTPMWGEMSKEYMDEQASGHLIERWIEPEEIADGIVFLAKNDAVCGEVLVIDGGMSLKTLG